MATCKLSTIITDIAGSVGGVTFRRHGGQTVVSKKSRGPSRATSLGNARLPQMRTLITNWNALTQTVRDAWATAALNFTFPDKFGVQRHLSGRELYLKLQGNLIVTGGSALDPTTLASAITMGVNPVLRVAMSLSNQLALNSIFANGAGNLFDNWSIVESGGSTITESLIGGINNGRAILFNGSATNDLIQISQAGFDIGVTYLFKVTARLISGVNGSLVTLNPSVVFPNFTSVMSTQSVNMVATSGSIGVKRNNLSNSILLIARLEIFKVTGFQATLNFDAVIAGTTVLLQAQKLKNNAIAATFTRRQIIANKNMNASSLFDFSLQLLEKFPDIKQNDLIRCYITYMNASGFRSVPQVIETTVLV